MLLAIVIHAVTVSSILGLIYGVLMPTLADDSQAAGLGRLAHAAAVDGGQLLLWASSIRCCEQRVDWPWFIASQFVFGMVAAVVYMRQRSKRSAVLAGLLAESRRAADAVPAVLWGVASGHGHLVSRSICWPRWSCPAWTT